MPINETLRHHHENCDINTDHNVELIVEKNSKVMSTPKSAKKMNELSGRRVVEVFAFIKEIQNSFSDHGPFGCSFKDMDVMSEIRLGLQSTINLKCKMCNLVKSIKTNNYFENLGTININEAAVVGTLSAGAGYSHISQIFSGMDIPIMNCKTYKLYESKVSTNFEKIAAKIMYNAAMEENNLAIENGDVDKDGVPLLTVICDGSWGKRSYRTMYNSSSGTVSELKIYSITI